MGELQFRGLGAGNPSPKSDLVCAAGLLEMGDVGFWPLAVILGG